MRGKLFGTNGVRGIINKELTADFAVRFGIAIGSFFDGGSIYVGHDGRTSSPLLSYAITSGLLSTGCEVYNLGTAPTPAIQYTVRKERPNGGVVITASHNPPPYNGIKVLGRDGVEISREEERLVENIYFSWRVKQADWNRIKKPQFVSGFLERYKEDMKKHIDTELVSKRRFKVVLDLGNGAGALVIPELLRECGCEVITLNANVDGTFPGRAPEPTPDQLKNLSQVVVSVGADLGVAYDGDADRAIFCDERGEVIWGDKSAAIIMEYVLKKFGGKQVIVTPVSSSKLIEDVASKYDAEVIWTKVGSVEVSHTMKRVGSIYGCEENGGCFYGPHQPVRDGAMTTLLMLDCLAKEGRKLSEMASAYRSYYIVKEKIHCDNTIKDMVLQKILDMTKDYERITIDGVKITLPEGRVLIRPSGTEPVFRVYSEGTSYENARRLADMSLDMVKKAIRGVTSE